MKTRWEKKDTEGKKKRGNGGRDRERGIKRKRIERMTKIKRERKK